MATPSITESQVFAALRQFLLVIVPGPEIVRAPTNRVPTPKDPFIALSPVTQTRLSTNVTAYNLTDARADRQAIQYAIQIDCYGPSASDWATVISTLLRSDYACSYFTDNSLPIQALYAEDPKQLPIVDGEDQYEERWMVVANLQYNPVISNVQQFADAVEIDLIDVEVEYRGAVDFTGTPRTGEPGLIVDFTLHATNGALSQLWHFGDGGTSTAQNPSHEYAAEGSFDVSVTVTNIVGPTVVLKENYIVVQAEHDYVLDIECTGPNGSTTFTDTGTYGAVVTVIGGTHIQNDEGVFATPGDALSVSNDAAFNFGLDNFEIALDYATTQAGESYSTIMSRGFAFINGSMTLMSSGAGGDGRPQFWLADFSQSAPFLLSSMAGLNDGVKRNIKVVRSGANFSMLIDDVSVATGTFSGVIDSLVGIPLIIGDDANFHPRGYVGTQSRIRISRSAP